MRGGLKPAAYDVPASVAALVAAGLQPRGHA
jgi:hypothetical protein